MLDHGELQRQLGLRGTEVLRVGVCDGVVGRPHGYLILFSAHWTTLSPRLKVGSTNSFPTVAAGRRTFSSPSARSSLRIRNGRRK